MRADNTPFAGQGAYPPPDARPASPSNQAENAAAAARRAAANRTDERQLSLMARYTFRHSPTPRAALPRPNIPMLRRLPSWPAPQQANAAAQQNEVDHRDDAAQREESHQADPDASRSGRRKHDLDAEDRSDSRSGFEEHGSERDDPHPYQHLKARPSPRRSQPPAAQVLARSGLPEAGSLFVRHGPQPRDPKRMLDSLASLLLQCVGQSSRKDPQKPTPTAVMLAALQVHMASQIEAAPDPLSLGEVKALLLARPPGPATPGADAQTAQNAYLLLPLFLLNATRPRTDAQRRQAMERLQQLRGNPGLS